MRVRKADDNQPVLVKQMRKIPGLTVAHTHTVGNGFVDVVVGHKGLNYLFEIKDPAKPPSARKLTKDELIFHSMWTGSIYVVETIDDVIKILKP
jgi:RNA-splicing ligase RtcB